MKNPHTLAALALALAALVPAARADTALTLTGSGGSTTIGGSTTLALTLDLPTAVPVLALTLSFDWDGAGLSFDRAASSGFGISWASLVGLGGPDPDTIETSSAGSYTLNSVLLGTLNLPAGQPTLQLAFTGLSAGAFPVTYHVDLVDDQFATIAGTGSAPITVSAVPEPTPALALLAGLGVLGWMAKRRAA